MAKGFDFRNAPAHLIRRAHQRAGAFFTQELGPFDITPVQFAILMTLLEKPGIDQVTLSDYVALDAATSGSVIGRLEARKWLRRDSDSLDRRRKLLWITPEGEEVAIAAAERGPRIQEQLMRPLDAQEQEQLIALLARLYQPADATTTLS